VSGGENKLKKVENSKTQTGLFQRIVDFTNLYEAYLLTRLGKRYQVKVCQFDYFLEPNLAKISYELLSGRYQPSSYTHFTIFDPKTRQVAAPAFRDRVVQHSLVAVIEPLFDKGFIYDSYACRKGRGTHFGAKRIKKFLMAARCLHGKNKSIYGLQCDVEKFFQSISWDVLLELIKKKVNCARTSALIEKIITTPELPEKVVSIKKRKGLPIGNLTSQLFANVYLSELDYFVKENLRERWYARYMDDFLIIHPDKDHLKQTKEKISVFLKDRLKLKLHPKKLTIKDVKDGVPFVGYRIFYDHVLIRGNTLLRMQRNYRKKTRLVKAGKLPAEKLAQTQASICGHLKHANAWNLKRKLFNS